MSFSIFGEDSPPKGLPSPDNYLAQRNAPVAIEQNVSYARSLRDKDRRAVLASSQTSLPHLSRLPAVLPLISPNPGGKPKVTLPLQKPQENHSQNHSNEDERFLQLAHEALVATTEKSNLLVDPTIQDLLARLKYAQSPHGNPIKRGDQVVANDNGQLMIQQFYDGFPNMSNDIFTSSSNHPSNTDNTAWNFLLDKNEHSFDDPRDDHSDSHDDRKFPCPNCNMSFRRSSDLKRHEKQHLKIPANICPDCGKGFARKDALKRHRGTLTCKRNKDKRLHQHNLQYLKKM